MGPRGSLLSESTAVIEKSEHDYIIASSLPVGGQLLRLRDGMAIPVYPDRGIRIELEDGSQWEYRGISAYACDNANRVKGWQRLHAV